LESEDLAEPPPPGSPPDLPSEPELEELDEPELEELDPLELLELEEPDLDDFLESVA
jgi:hypothetical protein